MVMVVHDAMVQTTELLVSRAVAEATLAKHNGDMEKALGELVAGP